MIAFPNCKINLGLHILQKRTDGFHDLETVFYPIPLHDCLEIIQNPTASEEIQLTVSGLELPGHQNENICFKAWQLLKKDFPELPVVKMHLHKTIPPGAGLGGGSADGTFAVLLINRKFSLGLDEKSLINYALQLGSDCPFFIRNKPSYALGRGEVLETIELDLSAYKIVVVNPAIPISTGWAFSMIKPSPRKGSIKEIIRRPVSDWKDLLVNDFEETVFASYPEIKNIKDTLYQKAAMYASMSGSGSTVYGLFEKTAQPSFSFPDHYYVKHI